MQVQEQAIGLLFTDMSGQVIFADPFFLRLMNYSEAGVVTGEPLHKALGLEQKAAKQILDDLRDSGNIENRIVEIPRPSGKPIRLAFNAVATFDPGGMYIGADITLNVVDSKIDTAEIRIKDHADVINTKIQQSLASTLNIEIDENMALRAIYFNTQLEALYVLVSRLLGIKATTQLDSVVNKTATKNYWSITIKNGHFTSDLSSASETIYTTLLKEAVNFAVDMIGKKVVTREIQTVDSKMDAKTLSATEGIRKEFISYL
jgi:hypothetical protein